MSGAGIVVTYVRVLLSAFLSRLVTSSLNQKDENVSNTIMGKQNAQLKHELSWHVNA